MTKAELIEEITTKTELPRRDVTDVVDHFLESVKSALAKGEKVQLIPFGSFEVRKRKAREGRNPKTGEKLMIAARSVPAFHPGKDLREAVQKGGKKK
ncbi:MAG TPA: HU family DNA-binding protein [Candidatus Acidoferrales bacterium]|jgi:DNA-binding protein HU-beta|nr:HU family DNA-binding protein [Candidatus Acidoferrales bacterium]